MTNVQIETVRSADGMTIACEIDGTGPALVLVEGAMGTRAAGFTDRLASTLADRFTTVIYDRRGRGDSTDTTPYTPEREIEDIAARSWPVDRIRSVRERGDTQCAS